MDRGTEAQKNIWEAEIPLQIHLHESEVTTLPPPPPALILAPRIGYLPLLVPQLKPFFSSTLPPGVDTVWFDYKGLPLKWYIPTGVLFDLLCAEPERPWNLTVHFRGYPGNILTPCEGEDNVKWSFINSLKEAAYIISGNCKNVMNMSQLDQVELWRSVLNGNLEAYLRVSSKLKLGTGKIPVRLYVWNVSEDFDYLKDAPPIDSWDKISYINRPVEINEEGTDRYFTLRDAITTLLPEFFADKSSINDEVLGTEVEDEQRVVSDDTTTTTGITEEVGEKLHKHVESCCLSDDAEIKLIRIHGIKPKLELPFTWVVNNLMNPEHFLHICVYVKVSEPVSI